MYSGYSGLILVAYLLYLFLTRMELFLIISFMLESFSIISQSLTLSNRLSINILAGSLLISLLSVAVIIFSIYLIINSILIILLLIIYSFEILNSFVQLFIFGSFFCSPSSVLNTPMIYPSLRLVPSGNFFLDLNRSHPFLSKRLRIL